jgi:hypothetical protein
MGCPIFDFCNKSRRDIVCHFTDQRRARQERDQGVRLGVFARNTQLLECNEMAKKYLLSIRRASSGLSRYLMVISDIRYGSLRSPSTALQTPYRRCLERRGRPIPPASRELQEHPANKCVAAPIKERDYD